MKKIAVFASGGGTNLQSIIEAVEDKTLKAEIAFVLSNNSKAGALERARRHKIPAVHLSIKQYDSPKAYETAMLKLLSGHKLDLVALAGYMKIVPAQVVTGFKGAILNIHPALLPKFGGEGMYGRRVHEAVIRTKEKESGVTVHFVTEKYDEGPAVMQEKVSIDPGETALGLAQKILEMEHKIYPLAIQKVLTGEIQQN